VLDCFAGTGTTGEAAYREGCSAILIEREPEYQADIRRRMGLVLAGPDERLHATIKAKGLVQDAGPLFAGSAA
jgi:site-specific DNA-methyltransferase (adenine-specific)